MVEEEVIVELFCVDIERLFEQIIPKNTRLDRSLRGDFSQKKRNEKSSPLVFLMSFSFNYLMFT
jgi:hypothetical protein